MRLLDSAMHGYLADDSKTLCHVWRVTRTDATVFGFTDHDVSITFDGITYEAQSGFTARTEEIRAGLSVDHSNILGSLSSASITSDDILQGKFNDATIDVGVINYNDPPADWDSGLLIHLTTGVFGRFTRKRDTFSVEMLSFTNLLNVPYGSTTSQICRFDLGDPDTCKVDLDPLKFLGTVVSVYKNLVVKTSGITSSTGTFSNGTIEFTSGNLNGTTLQVFEQNDQDIALYRASLIDINVGDTFTLKPGCDKLITTCESFANTVRFGGEPYIPGPDKINAGKNGGGAAAPVVGGSFNYHGQIKYIF